ncbi:hypothetical protein [Delftia acidovorans]|uniref:hypothetical protein n=1 Tax=Delftia acidovorans TaxID=80866 RepID=UPI002FDD93D6
MLLDVADEAVGITPGVGGGRAAALGGGGLGLLVATVELVLKGDARGATPAKEGAAVVGDVSMLGFCEFRCCASRCKCLAGSNLRPKSWLLIKLSINLCIYPIPI